MAARVTGSVVVVVVAMLQLLLMVGLSVVDGAVYKVGDSAGWTTIGNVDYKKWAATKTFTLSDVIVFQYNPQFHNVMQVSHEAYRACNASSPFATHTTGNDTIIVTRHGHYFFMCGVPGHCQAGQKVDIRVPHISASPSMAPTPSVSEPSSSPANPAPNVMSPSPSSAAVTVAPLQGLVSITAAGLLTILLHLQCLM